MQYDGKYKKKGIHQLMQQIIWVSMKENSLPRRLGKIKVKTICSGAQV